MAVKLYYIVHETKDPKSKIIFQGTCGQVTKQFDVDSYHLKKVAHSVKHILKGQHYMETIPYAEWKEKNDAKPAPKREKNASKLRLQLDEIERHLDIYGNTIIYKNAKKIETGLEKDGYFVNMVHEPKRVIKMLTKGHKEVYPECWIINLTKKETMEC